MQVQITHLLRPHWKALAIAFIAVLGESATDLLAPWPLKIIFDYVLSSKRMPEWLATVIQATFGTDKTAVLGFAALAVMSIAVVGAISSVPSQAILTPFRVSSRRCCSAWSSTSSRSAA